jgi:hypothetical protein
MPTAVLTYGVPTALVQNTVYALPANRAIFFTDATTPTVQQSYDVAFTANAVLTLVSGQAEVAGGFIRSTAGNINCVLKKL